MASENLTSDKPEARRRYSAELKAQVVTQCDVPGASVAKVAMTHGINANVVHRWRQLARDAQGPVPAGGNKFVAVSLIAAAQVASPGDIHIELRRGATAMTITWPVAGADQCAAWMRELLR